MAELARLWAQALAALTRCADLSGHTPSDFPLIPVTQDDIDAWARSGVVEDVLPLLPLQQGMYFHHIVDDTASYVVQQVAQLSGPVEPDVLAAAAGGAAAPPGAAGQLPRIA
ncbi:hypothetical protein MANY_54170 [Mycolicibacterium anyangense]|uniref:Condensation domain-containing protein n=2 Tax=Mycolicibacterium anyangense TaxID=1431246 RepID=A0A6N4WDL9_9MYCO|nr:hypothetical protein MANY_54170 [Mycolicibacterium anyangense]